MPDAPQTNMLRYSVSLVTQGDHRFYSLTIPSEVLARTCFVTTRDENPSVGFQRVLDRDRAKEIADYIDTGFGTIPNSVILSAQQDAQLKIIGRGKTMEFADVPRAFLILDGQHRVYGFSIAKKSLRVPVVIYSGLSRKDESRLFIDINTKQRPVPNVLLLDIKKLAEYESEFEQFAGTIFDLLAGNADSPLRGLMSPAKSAHGKITRVTFYSALKLIHESLQDRSPEDTYAALREYLRSFIAGLESRSVAQGITNPTLFRAAIRLFYEAAQRVKDKHSGQYSETNFADVLRPVFSKIPPKKFRQPGNSPAQLHRDLADALKPEFRL